MNTLGHRIFIRSLGLCYFLAFASLMIQLRGLISSHGILPAAEFLGLVSHNISGTLFSKFLQLPSLFWFNASDRFLFGACFLGIVLSLNLIVRKDRNKFDIVEFISLLMLYLLYLSFVNVSRDFLSFQWDILLLETGFLSTVFVLCKTSEFATKVITWLFRLLVFKLMFMSGLVKLYTHDETWANMTALTYHYYTQPLPNPLSFFVHQLPRWFHLFSCALMFVIELIVPLFIFGGRFLRQAAALLFIGFQLVIIATGNYCFFNLLTIFLCIWLVDDSMLEKLLPDSIVMKFHRPQEISDTDQIFSRQIAHQLIDLNSLNPRNIISTNIIRSLIIILASIIIVTDAFFIIIRSPVNPTIISNIIQMINPLINPLANFHLNNPYGLFATMTTTRNEIVIQGTNDLKSNAWLDYEFFFKPQNPKNIPAQVAPYQPRLDWQMWFAALSSYREQPWFVNFCIKLLEGEASVLRLLKYNPYPDHPPKYLRAIIYEYKFNNLEVYARSGEYWSREYREEYMPVINLR